MDTGIKEYIRTKIYARAQGTQGIRFAAQHDTTWFDSRWRTTAKSKASFYRPAPVKQGNFYVIRDYYLDGTLQYKGMSTGLGEKDPREGECVWYYPDAKTSSSDTYKNGKKNGPSIKYFPNGKLLWELHYKDDEEEGVFTSYYSDGTVKLSGSYKSGSKRGLWTYYTMDGKKAGWLIGGKSLAHCLNHD